MGKMMQKNWFYSKVWLPLQHILFAFVICWLVLCVWTFYLHPRHMIRKKKKMEMFFYAMFFISFWGPWYSMWWMFPHHSFGSFLLIWLGLGQVSGPYIFINFWVSHTHLDVIDMDKHVTWIEYSSKHTMNCDDHWFTNWWMAYLNFQIEHHLFPQCPQYRFPQVSPRVRALFEKHGEEYKSLPYFKAMEITFANLKHISEEVAEELLATTMPAKKTD